MNESKRYGIYNTVAKSFVYGISEPTERRAIKTLFERIGKNAYKWRYQARVLPNTKKSI